VDSFQSIENKGDAKKHVGEKCPQFEHCPLSEQLISLDLAEAPNDVLNISGVIR
jgi:hypothetical protein